MGLSTSTPDSLKDKKEPFLLNYEEPSHNDSYFLSDSIEVEMESQSKKDDSLLLNNISYTESDEMFFSDDLTSSLDGPWLKYKYLEWLDLSKATIVGGILGIGFGMILSEAFKTPNFVLTFINYPGLLWINGLKLLTLPLLVSLMVLIPLTLSNKTLNSNTKSQHIDIKKLTKLSLTLYIFTSFVAAISGLIWVNIIKPGKYGNPNKLAEFEGDSTDEKLKWYENILQVFENAIPPNIINAMVELNILGTLLFFLTLGYLLKRVKNENNPYSKGAVHVFNFFRTLLRCSTYFMIYFIWFTPVGMLSLVTTKCAETDNLFSLLKALGYYLLCQLIGQLVHMFVFYFILFFSITKQNPFSYFWTIKQSVLTGFATSSSSATLSISLKTAKLGGVNSDVKNLIIPLGSAINMDGTSLGFPIMVLFISQLYNIKLNIGIQLSIVLLSMICSIGTAPIPNGGMIYLVMLLQSAGNGLNDNSIIETAVATLFLIDWFVDRLETAQNINSDQFIAKIISHLLTKNKQFIID